MGDDILAQPVSLTPRGGSLLDLLFGSRGGLVGEVKVAGCVEHSSHGLVECLALGEGRSVVSRATTLDIQGVGSDLFGSLIDRVPWEANLKGRGSDIIQEGEAQLQAILMS